ncbi:MAG: flavin reductase family protein [Alphaproteobacteria bacterium]|nr:flavin reductase family protein [Alphaproteobacteria bacterium]
MNKSRDFRDVLGRYPTGVAIVTARVDGRPVGVTINSFASVSLDPPLVLWSIERERERYELFEKVEEYAINILARDQSNLAHACALNADLTACEIPLSDDAVPRVLDTAAYLLCKRSAVFPGGDHDIILGEVVQFDTVRDEPSLVFYRGRYGEPS